VEGNLEYSDGSPKDTERAKDVAIYQKRPPNQPTEKASRCILDRKGGGDALDGLLEPLWIVWRLQRTLTALFGLQHPTSDNHFKPSHSSRVSVAHCNRPRNAQQSMHAHVAEHNARATRVEIKAAWAFGAQKGRQGLLLLRTKGLSRALIVLKRKKSGS
jgi:hypothetical protein